MNKVLVTLSVLILTSLFSCSNNSKEFELQNENTVLKYQLDTLQNSYNILNQKYIDIKNKRADTVKILVPTDSINWIDSIRYDVRDSVQLIPHDTLITHIKDSLVYNFRGTLLYNYLDSVIVSYDERTFPEENIERYLNLFFQTDNVEDTAGLRFNFSVFNGRKRNYLLDTNYNVPDSLTGWRLEWYLKSQKSKVKSQK
jgi:hypothetical protein